MKLYKIYQNVNSGYDTYDSAIVAANSENEARNINVNTSFLYDDDEYWRYHGWCKPEHVKVDYIGEAVDGTELGIILSSFNAG